MGQKRAKKGPIIKERSRSERPKKPGWQKTGFLLRQKREGVALRMQKPGWQKTGFLAWG
jgi:hypothetical protein